MPHSERTHSPTQDHPAEPPSFPDNIPTAPLLRISLAKLLQSDASEQEKCWRACCELGFFYLDLRSDGSDGGDKGDEALLACVEQLFEAMKEFFDLPVGEKTGYDFAERGSYFGYKGYGKGIVDAEGRRDKNEFYNVRSSPSAFPYGVPCPWWNENGSSHAKLMVDNNNRYPKMTFSA